MWPLCPSAISSPCSLSSAFVGSFILSSALGPSEMKIVFDWDRRPTCAKDSPGHIFRAQ